MTTPGNNGYCIACRYAASQGHDVDPFRTATYIVLGCGMCATCALSVFSAFLTPAQIQAILNVPDRPPKPPKSDK